MRRVGFVRTNHSFAGLRTGTVSSAFLTPTVAAKSCDSRSDDRSVNRSEGAGFVERAGDVRPLSLGTGLTLGCFGAGGDFGGLRLRTDFLHNKRTSRGPGRPAHWLSGHNSGSPTAG